MASNVNVGWGRHAARPPHAAESAIPHPFRTGGAPWGELTLRLSNRRVRFTQHNDRAEFAASGSYTTRADVLKLHFDELGETWGYRWSLYRGTLKLERDKSLGTPPELHAPTPLLVNPWRRIR